jgi:hypothetical protein
MWIKPGQHGTSAQVSLRSPTRPTFKAFGRRSQVSPQRGTASSPLATQGTGTLVTRGRTAPERLSLGRTCTAL